MHREPDVGFDPGSPGSRPGPKAGAKPLRHPGIPRPFLFDVLCVWFSTPPILQDLQWCHNTQLWTWISVQKSVLVSHWLRDKVQIPGIEALLWSDSSLSLQPDLTNFSLCTPQCPAKWDCWSSWECICSLKIEYPSPHLCSLKSDLGFRIWLKIPPSAWNWSPLPSSQPGITFSSLAPS